MTSLYTPRLNLHLYPTHLHTTVTSLTTDFHYKPHLASCSCSFSFVPNGALHYHHHLTSNNLISLINVYIICPGLVCLMLAWAVISPPTFQFTIYSPLSVSVFCYFTVAMTSFPTGIIKVSFALIYSPAQIPSPVHCESATEIK